MRKMMRLVLLVIIGILMLFCVGWTEDSKENATTFTTGIFSEKDTDRFDYAVNYSIISRDKLRVQYDYFFDNPSVNGYQRLWVNYGSFDIVESEDCKINFRPGIIATNFDKFYYGGLIDIDVLKWKFHLHQKSYAGNLIDKHITFTTLGITKNLFLQHYYYMEKGLTPDSYIGPGVNLGSFSGWVGSSTIRPRAWSLDVSFTKRF